MVMVMMVIMMMMRRLSMTMMIADRSHYHANARMHHCYIYRSSRALATIINIITIITSSSL